MFGQAGRWASPGGCAKWFSNRGEATNFRWACIVEVKLMLKTFLFLALLLLNQV